MVVEHLERAWEAYRRNFKPIMIAYLFIMFFSLFFVFMGIFFGVLPFIVYSASQASLVQLTMMIPFIAFGALMFLISMIISVLFQGGFIAMSAEALKGKTKLSTLFDTIKKRWVSILCTEFFRCLICLCLFSPAILLGISTLASGISLSTASFYTIVEIFLVSLVAGLISLLFMFNVYSVVLDKASAADGIIRSFKIANKNYLQLLMLLLILVGISMVIGFFPIIGTIITVLFMAPFMIIAMTSFYLSNRSKKR